MANTKDVFTSILSYFILAGNKFTVNIALGLIISTLGAVMFSSKSIYDNMLTGKGKKINTQNDSEINKLKVERPKTLSLKRKRIK